MDMIRCPKCEEELPENANYCAKCGDSLEPSEQEIAYFHDSQEQSEAVDSPAKRRVITAKLVEDSASMEAIPGHFAGVVSSRQRGYSDNRKESSQSLNYRPKNTGNVLEKERPLTWQKEVEPPPSRPLTTSIPPRPTTAKNVIVKKSIVRSVLILPWPSGVVFLLLPPLS